MIWVPSFSPSSMICPGALLYRTSCPSPLSFRPFSSSPSINEYSAAPLQCLVPPIFRPPLSVRRRATNPPAPADQCPLLVPRPSVPYAGLHPPPPPDLYGWWYLAWVWVCVEGQKKETAPRGGRESVVSSAGITVQTAKCMPPPDARLPSRFLRSAIDMSPSTRLVGFARESVPSLSLEFSLASCVPVSLSAPPPPSPFPCTTVRFPLLSLLTGECFCGCSARSPAPLGPAVRAAAFLVSGPRSCPLPPPPPYYLAISSGSRSPFIGLVAV